MAYHFSTFLVVLIVHETTVLVNSQCTTQGCDNGDPLTSIAADIQQLRVELFNQLNKQVLSRPTSELNASMQETKSQHDSVMTSLQIIHEILDASLQEIKSHHANANKSIEPVDRCPQERYLCNEQFQSMHEIFNESFQEIKIQHDAIVSSLQAVNRRLEEHDISTRNQTRNSLEEQNIIIRNQTRDSLEEHDISMRNQTKNSRTFENGSCGSTSEVCDCSDIKASGQNRSGVYEVCVRHELKGACSSAFCDMETAYRVSLVFQRRKDGSVNFNRTWAEYREGFGNPDGEFWLGNEMLYLLTSKRNYKLRIDLEDWEGEKRYAEYSNFSIDSSTNNYSLTIGGYSGNAGDSMYYNNGRQFSTIDADNNEYRRFNFCAGKNGGAWWYGGCSYAYLNGKYHQRHDTVQWENGIMWNHFKRSNTHFLKATEMKLVPVD